MDSLGSLERTFLRNQYCWFGGIPTPLKIWVRQLGWWHSQYMGKCSKPPTRLDRINWINDSWYWLPGQQGFKHQGLGWFTSSAWLGNRTDISHQQVTHKSGFRLDEPKKTWWLNHIQGWLKNQKCILNQRGHGFNRRKQRILYTSSSKNGTYFGGSSTGKKEVQLKKTVIQCHNYRNLVGPPLSTTQWLIDQETCGRFTNAIFPYARKNCWTVHSPQKDAKGIAHVNPSNTTPPSTHFLIEICA